MDELALYDVVNTPGVTADLSHISSVAVHTALSLLSAQSIDLSRKSPGSFPQMVVFQKLWKELTSALSPLAFHVGPTSPTSLQSELTPRRQTGHDP